MTIEHRVGSKLIIRPIEQDDPSCATDNLRMSIDWGGNKRLTLIFKKRGVKAKKGDFLTLCSEEKVI